MFVVTFYRLEDYLLFHKEITKGMKWRIKEGLTNRNGVIGPPFSIFKSLHLYQQINNSHTVMQIHT